MDKEKASISGSMTLKDVIIHIVWFELEMIHLLETRTLQGSPLWNYSTDERNARIQALHAGDSWQAVIEQFDAAQPKLLQLLEAIDEKALHHPQAFINMPEDWSPWQIISENTCEHYEHHAKDIEESINKFANETRNFS